MAVGTYVFRIFIVGIIINLVAGNAIPDTSTEKTEVTIASNETDVDERIVFGNKVPQGKYPFVVAIEYNFWSLYKQVFCGGVILAEHWVVTAAHCFRTEENHTRIGAYYVHAGEVNKYTYQYPNTQLVKIQEKFIHPQYEQNFRTIRNDIALLLLKKSLHFNQYVQSISLPPPDYPIKGAGIMIGWGANNPEGTNIPDYLQEMMVQINPNEQCRRARWIPLTDKQICLALNDYTTGCSGDSGGPFIQYTTNVESVYVLGITSFGLQGCYPKDPIVHTKITAHLDFINATMTSVPVPPERNTFESVLEAVSDGFTNLYHFLRND